MKRKRKNYKHRNMIKSKTVHIQTKILKNGLNIRNQIGEKSEK